MTPEEKLPILINRLVAACYRTGDGRLFSKGIEVIRRKYGYDVYLSKFVPCDMQEGEAPTMQANVTVNGKKS